MSTNSYIIVECMDGKFRRIYCHHDGYLRHNGKILQEHYATQEKAEALMALGDLSGLGPEIGVKHPFDRPFDSAGAEAWKAAYGNYCHAYGRDRGEKHMEADVLESLIEAIMDTGSQRKYVWRKDAGKWFYGQKLAGSQLDGLVELEKALVRGS